MPVFYYWYKGGKIETVDEKKWLKQYLVASMANCFFTDSSPDKLSWCRNKIKSKCNNNKIKNGERFKIDIFKSEKEEEDYYEKLNVTEDKIKSWFEGNKYNKNKITFAILLAIQTYHPGNDKCDQDHLHPKAKFPEDDEEKRKMRDKLPNLQLLFYSYNREKKDEELYEYVKKNQDYVEFIEKEKKLDLDFFKFENFKAFYYERKHNMTIKLKQFFDLA